MSDQSDLELLVRVRAGDPQAEAMLLARHRDAVAELGASPNFTSVDASGKLALALVRQGADHDLPFRATWLGLHARGSLPAMPDGESVVWAAFRSLPAAWRTAVWHREVEGHRPREIARLLGMTENQTGRALASAYASLKRRVALAHPDAGPEGPCADLVDPYRFSPPASLPAAEIRDLREHGRHCDSCLGLIRDLLLVEHTLRTTLAATVLGPAAEAYLARRPRVTRLRVPGPDLVRPPRRVNPVLATISAASLGAAAMALVVSAPVVSPSTQTPREVYAAEVPAPGRLLTPGVQTVGHTPSGSDGLGAGGTTLSPVAADAAAGDGADDGADDRDPDGPNPDEPVVPGDPTVPTPPATPPTTPPTTPPDDPEDPDDPDDPADVVVAVQVDDGGASVSVDPPPGPNGPIVVEVPVPDVPLPEELPDADVGGLLP